MSQYPDSPKVDNILGSFRRKLVYSLSCKFCGQKICDRAMKAVLISDTTTELYSTDNENRAVDVTDNKYYTERCSCLLENVACVLCGNVVGYHVRIPCISCLRSCNNGHFWIFHSKNVQPFERLNDTGEDHLVWGDLPSASQEHILEMMADECCR